jgi:hypothetical protein
LKGRVFTFQVLRDADGNASFRQPRIGDAIRAKIVSILGLEEAEVDRR